MVDGFRHMMPKRTILPSPAERSRPTRRRMFPPSPGAAHESLDGVSRLPNANSLPDGARAGKRNANDPLSDGARMGVRNACARTLLGPARALQRPESCPLLKSYFGHLCLHDHTAKPNRTRGRRRRRQRRRAGDGRGGRRTEGRNTGGMGARTHGRREGGMDGGTKGRRGGMTEGRSGGRTEGRRDETTEGTLEERMEGWMGSKDGLT